jgi:hypothetical protein
MRSPLRSDALSIVTFSNSFRKEAFGWVYASDGGRGEGWPVSEAERNAAIDGYTDVVVDTRIAKDRALRSLMWVVLIGLVAGLMVPPVLRSAYLIIALVTCSIRFLWLDFKPSKWKRAQLDKWSRRPLMRGLTKKEQIKRGYRWPLWGNIAFYLFLAFIIFLEAGRIGDAGMQRLFGSKFVEIHKIAEDGVILFAGVSTILAGVLHLTGNTWPQRQARKLARDAENSRGSSSDQ